MDIGGTEISEQDFYWLAGILEGEGSFMAPPPSSPNSPTICMVSTDRDVVDRVASIFRTSVYQCNPDRHDSNGWKRAFGAKIRGERAVSLMISLKPHMSIRRQGQIDRAISQWTLVKRKITRDQYLEIISRCKTESTASLGIEYGVSRQFIWQIKTGKISGVLYR